MYIYCITNNLNGKKYVGQTIQPVQKRWTAHCCYKSGGGRSVIKDAIKKYGKESFTFELLETVINKKDVDNRERFWIEKNNSLSPNGYNVRTGGHTGYTYSKEIRKIMSEKKKGVIPHNKNKKGITAKALDGSFSLFFRGLSEAVECGFEKSTIYSVINGKYTQYLGMKWSFE